MYKTIIHATDLADNHFAMCQKALAIAQCFNATFYLLHVLETPASVQLSQGLGFSEIEDPAMLIEDAHAVMHLLGETLNIPKKNLLVETGSVKQKVFETIKELNCPLLIIGHHTHGQLSEYLGNTSQSIVRGADFDVLTLN